MAEKKDKVMFARKLEELEQIMVQIRSYEERISELMIAKQPLIDELTVLRQQMVKICVHPKDFLFSEGDHVVCKFCNKRLQVNGRED